MARTFFRGWSVVGLLTVSLVGLPWWAVPAAAQIRAERKATAGATSPADDPFADPSAPANATGPARRDTRKAPNDLELEARIRKALDGPTVMEFIETPLDQAVDYLKDLHGIEIQLDNRALEEAGIGADLPISCTLKGISLASALRLMLRQFDLTYVVRHGVMLLTTPAAVRKMVELRVYDVRDLLGDDADAGDVTAILQLVLEPAPTTGVCQSQIVPLGNLLVVRASIAEQQAVADLLDSIRQERRRAKK